MVLRLSNGQEDLVERTDSPQQSEAASCLLLFQSLLCAVSSFSFLSEGHLQLCSAVRACLQLAC